MDKNSIAKRKGMGNNAERILLFLVVSQILFLLIFNVCRMKYMVNFDSSTYMVQVMQIWKQGTLLIHDYYYSTMLTWDMPTLIAVVFYGIFHDVFLAYALADDVLIILFALVLNKLCNDLGLSKVAKIPDFCCCFCHISIWQCGLYRGTVCKRGALWISHYVHVDVDGRSDLFSQRKPLQKGYYYLYIIVDRIFLVRNFQRYF